MFTELARCGCSPSQGSRYAAPASPDDVIYRWVAAMRPGFTRRRGLSIGSRYAAPASPDDVVYRSVAAMRPGFTRRRGLSISSRYAARLHPTT
ncbi:MAG TPA: hypothetical protein VNS63_27995 [Blastocatellia bacterium]|nr:hypothetical protein [Blastocatellia bacterium]